MRLLFIFALFVSLAVAAKIDTRFREYSCVVTGQFEEPNCDAEVPHFPPARFEVWGNNQVFYDTFSDALQRCPYNPVLIEVAGTIYIEEDLKYSSLSTLWIRGVLHLNETTGDVYSPTIVGFKNLYTTYVNTTIIFDSIILEGCGTTDPLFTSNHETLPGALIDQTFLATNITVSNYAAPVVLKQYSSDNTTFFAVENSRFVNINNTAINVIGDQAIRIHNNVFSNCGNDEHTCVIMQRHEDISNGIEMTSNRYT